MILIYLEHICPVHISRYVQSPSVPNLLGHNVVVTSAGLFARINSLLWYAFFYRVYFHVLVDRIAEIPDCELIMHVVCLMPLHTS